MKALNTEELTACPVCSAVNEVKGKDSKCYRCFMPIFNYTHIQTERSWAFLITAIIAYIPAHLYPMLITNKFGAVSENTIMGGIILLWQQGSYPIAIIIFFVSIFIPILKFLLLLYLLISVQYPLGVIKKLNRSKLHFITETIGPWSMIDVFVVAILMSLVHFISVEIITGTASTAFTISVLFTLLASRSFDARLIKDYK